MSIIIINFMIINHLMKIFKKNSITMKNILIAFSFLSILLNNAKAQFVGPAIISSQTTPIQISKQQLLNYLLSNSNQPIGKRIEVLATAVQQMPPKRQRRVYLADVLRQSALENLMVAASVCEATTGTRPIADIPQYAPYPLRQMVPNAIAGGEPLVANRNLLSALLPKELLASLFAPALPYTPNQAIRFPYV